MFVKLLQKLKFWLLKPSLFTHHHLIEIRHCAASWARNYLLSQKFESFRTRSFFGCLREFGYVFSQENARVASGASNVHIFTRTSLFRRFVNEITKQISDAVDCNVVWCISRLSAPEKTKCSSTPGIRIRGNLSLF